MFVFVALLWLRLFLSILKINFCRCRWILFPRVLFFMFWILSMTMFLNVVSGKRKIINNWLVFCSLRSKMKPTIPVTLVCVLFWSRRRIHGVSSLTSIRFEIMGNVDRRTVLLTRRPVNAQRTEQCRQKFAVRHFQHYSVRWITLTITPNNFCAIKSMVLYWRKP